MLRLVSGCGRHPTIACHSDMLRHGRGAGHKSHDCHAVPGCPDCHAVFNRATLGRDGYEEKWQAASDEYRVWMWTNGKVRVT